MLPTFGFRRRHAHPLRIIPSILTLCFVNLGEVVRGHARSTKLKLEVAYRSAWRVSSIEPRTGPHFLPDLLLRRHMQPSGVRQGSLAPFLLAGSSHPVLVCRLNSHFFQHFFCCVTYVPHLLIQIALPRFSESSRSLIRSRFLRALNDTQVSEWALSLS